MVELEPHPDVEPALSLLTERGIPAFTLTNGSATTVTALLDRAKLGRLVEAIISAEGVGTWKPRPEPYRYAPEKAGIAPHVLALVASHPWDIHGAARAGVVTGWVNRDARSFPASFCRPHVQDQNLVGVVEQLLALPEERDR